MLSSFSYESMTTILVGLLTNYIINFSKECDCEKRKQGLFSKRKENRIANRVVVVVGKGTSHSSQRADW